MIETLQLAVGIITALAAVFLLYGAGRTLEPRGELEQRIEAWVKSQHGRPDDRVARRGTSEANVLSRMERAVSRRGFAESIRTDLARADLALTTAEYMLIRIGLVVVGLGAGYLIGRSLVSALLLAVVCLFVPVLYVRTRQTRRLRAFNGQLPDVLDQIVGSLRAGYGLLQSVEWVSRQLPDPVGSEFDRVVREVQLGRGLSDALDSMVRRIDSDDLALIVTAIKVQYEVGGNLADVLATVADTIRERVRIQREILVLTAQQRYSGYVLMVMPIALGIVLFLINPEYQMQMFQPGPVLCVPIGTVVLMVIGFLVMRRIVDIEV
jgi:tight adherence protein B